jgi:hypothetical protein
MAQALQALLLSDRQGEVTQALGSPAWISCMLDAKLKRKIAEEIVSDRLGRQADLTNVYP